MRLAGNMHEGTAGVEGLGTGHIHKSALPGYREA